MAVSEEQKHMVKDIIIEIEHTSQLFRQDEVVDKAKEKGIPESDVKSILTELIQDKYIHVVRGTDNLLARTVWRDYSPAFEELPDY